MREIGKLQRRSSFLLCNNDACRGCSSIIHHTVMQISERSRGSPQAGADTHVIWTDPHEDRRARNASGVTIIKLAGRMDIAGSGDVDTKLNILAGVKPRIVVDMSDVDFLASLGCARS